MTKQSITFQRSFLHTPRDYQLRLENDILAQWQAGARNVLAVLPTGGGKTFVFSRIAASTAGAVCAIAHRGELVSQMSSALAREGVRHRVIGPAALERTCATLQTAEFGRHFVDPNARVAVAGVDTLVRKAEPWFNQVSLWIQDECHHVLADNKWGKACALFPNARGLGVTATPVRADGKGLGRHADGLMDAMVVGPTMRDLIRRGYLTEYRIFAPPSDIDLSDVGTTGSGDFSPPKLSAARRKSHITGDVVEHYLRIARGKLGVTFDVDIESATETAAAYNAAGVPAQVVTGNTPDTLRASILRDFRARRILQLVNVDLFGEGFDLPAIEVVSFARPTQSYSLFCLDPETEVLTPRGWEAYGTACGAEDVIAFDPSDGTCRTVKVTGSVLRPRNTDEVMFGVVSPHLDVCVSDKHRMLVKGHSKTSKHWQWETAEEVSARKSMFRIPVAANGEFPGSGLTSAELEFLGWFLSDGSRNKITGGISIAQSASKPFHIADIQGVIARCGFKFGAVAAKRVGKFSHLQENIITTVSFGAPRGTDKHLTGYARIAEWCDKSLPSCYDRLTREELVVMLRTLNLGDGWNDHACADWTPRTMRIACGTNKVMADRLQALCVTRGFRCNVAAFRGPAGAMWHIAYIKDTQHSSVAGSRTKDGSVSGKKAYKRSRFGPREDSPAFVWCLTNDLGTLITRRNGKVSIVGNCQQFGRSLRPLDGKPHAVIIDHVGNVARHGLPDAPREWSLDRRERRSRSAPSDVIPVRTCLAPTCLAVYERIYSSCPYCGHAPVPAGRSAPEQVDGDLFELDAATLAAMRGEVARVDGPPTIPYGATPEVAGAIHKRHGLRNEAQVRLRQTVALWAGWQQRQGRSDSEAYRRFWFAFGTDVVTAQALGTREATELNERIQRELDRHQVVAGGLQ